MASPSVLSVAELLTPIPGDNPAGRAVREDFSPRSVYQSIKLARNTARAAERKSIGGGDAGGGDTERPDWRPVLQLVPKVIAEESKDLEIAAWLIEALVREHGFAGLRDGIRLVQGLVEQFWDNLYPMPDEDGMVTRVAPLTGLNGEDADGVLINPILNVPITAPQSVRPVSLIDFKQATDLERIDDPDKRTQRIDDGAVSLEVFEKSVRETPSPFFHNLLEDITVCAGEFEKLCTLLDEKCGRGSDGHPLAPPSSSIRNALKAVQDKVEQIVKERPAPLEDGPIGQESAPPDEAGASKGGRGDSVRNRQDALRLVLRTAEFFKRTEPHSPIAYLLEQAVRWGNMSLPDLWAELMPEETQRSQVFKLAGIRPLDRQQQKPVPE